MIIHFERIKMQNFLSIGEAEVILSVDGYTQVTGKNDCKLDGAASNGSGKSSIFEAIVWCLTGQTQRGVSDVGNIFSSGKTEVSLTATVDGKPLQVIRTRAGQKSGLRIIYAGEDISAKGIRETETVLEGILPGLSQVLGSVIIFGQGMPDRFTGNTPSGRKAFLEKVLNTDFMLEDLKDRISRRSDYLSEQLNAAEKEIVRVDTQVATSEVALNEAEKELSCMPDRPHLLEEERCVSEQLASATEEECRLKQLVETISDQVTSLRESLVEERQKLSGKTGELKDQENSERFQVEKDWAVVNAQLCSMQETLKEKQSITDICPTCGRKLEGVVKPDTSAIEDSIRICADRRSSLNAKLTAIAEKYKRTLEEVTAQSNTLQAQILSEGRSKAALLAEKKKEAEKASDNAKSLGLKLERVQANLVSIEATAAALSAKIAKEKQSIFDNRDKKCYIIAQRDELQERISIINKLKSFATRDFRGELLRDAVSFLNETTISFSRFLFGDATLTMQLDGNAIAVMLGDRAYEALSGGERQKADILIQLALRRLLCAETSFHSNILVLDEIFDQLDSEGCGRVVDLLAETLTDVDSVFVISHHGDELNIPNDHTILCHKGAGGITEVSQQ